jgi:hypothetical protein
MKAALLSPRRACLFTLFAIFLILSCGDKTIDRDRPRDVLTWDFPEDFEPALITTDDSGNRWGLFVSRRYSEKDNLWAVRSVQGGEWESPILLMNAYFSSELKFEVKREALKLAFTEIDDDYFWDYDQNLQDTMPFPETVTLEFSLTDLTKDDDQDGLPDRVEEELLLSTRLPDSDLDGKRDDVDFCPLAKPLAHAERFDIYREAIMYLMRLDDPAKMQPVEDTAWSRYYGIYYVYQPTVVFLALPGERFMPELLNLPIMLIQARSPLYFTGKRLYGSSTGGVIPHLVFERPRTEIAGSHAEMDIEYVTHKYKREPATIHFVRRDTGWEAESITKEE